MADGRPETLLAIEAVTRGLALAQRGVGRAEITEKGDRDLVTATDVAVEDEVRRILGEASSRPVVGEERGGEPPAHGSAYWLLDPICGTRNFASGIPFYAVNLALVEDDRVTVAVVGDPSTGEINVAELGQGAWSLSDGVRRPLRVSGESRILDVADGRAGGAPRPYRAIRGRGDQPGSVGLPSTRKHVGHVVRGGGPHLRLRPVLGVRASHRSGQPARH